MSPDVILLPGLASDEALWRDQRPALRAAGWRVQVSDAHQRAETLSAMGRLVLDDNPGPLVLVGTSMGGMVALHAWRQDPSRVRGLALLGTGARADTPEMIALRTAAIAEFEAGRAHDVLRANVPLAFHPSRQDDHAMVSAYFDMIDRAGVEGLIRQNRAVMAREDLRGELGRITCPVLVVCGEDDALTPPALSQEMADAVPGAQLHRLPDCGHLLTWEQPARVNALLLDWLRQLAPGTSPAPADLVARRP
jgi:pimeloyl-ACP methyl ester carboxylesterase